MQTYLLSIAAVVLACGSVQYLAGDLKLKKQIFFIAALCIVFSILSPLISWLPGAVDLIIPDISVSVPQDPDSANQMLLQEGERAVSDAICKQVQGEIGLNDGDISVSIHLSYEEIDNIYIKKIDVFLKRQTDGYLARDIVTYLEKQFACEVCVYVGGVEYAS